MPILRPALDQPLRKGPVRRASEGLYTTKVLTNNADRGRGDWGRYVAYKVRQIACVGLDMNVKMGLPKT